MCGGLVVIDRKHVAARRSSQIYDGLKIETRGSTYGAILPSSFRLEQLVMLLGEGERKVTRRHLLPACTETKPL